MYQSTRGIMLIHVSHMGGGHAARKPRLPVTNTQTLIFISGSSQRVESVLSEGIEEGTR